jgi:hypothetical protein
MTDDWQQLVLMERAKLHALQASQARDKKAEKNVRALEQGSYEESRLWHLRELQEEEVRRDQAGQTCVDKEAESCYKIMKVVQPLNGWDDLNQAQSVLKQVGRGRSGDKDSMEVKVLLGDPHRARAVLVVTNIARMEGDMRMTAFQDKSCAGLQKAKAAPLLMVHLSADGDNVDDEKSFVRADNSVQVSARKIIADGQGTLSMDSKRTLRTPSFKALLAVVSAPTAQAARDLLEVMIAKIESTGNLVLMNLPDGTPGVEDLSYLMVMQEVIELQRMSTAIGSKPLRDRGIDPRHKVVGGLYKFVRDAAKIYHFVITEVEDHRQCPMANFISVLLLAELQGVNDRLEGVKGKARPAEEVAGVRYHVDRASPPAPPGGTGRPRGGAGAGARAATPAATDPGRRRASCIRRCLKENCAQTSSRSCWRS